MEVPTSLALHVLHVLKMDTSATTVLSSDKLSAELDFRPGAARPFDRVASLARNKLIRPQLLW